MTDSNIPLSHPTCGTSLLRQVPELPPDDRAARKKLFEQLMSGVPDRSQLEARSWRLRGAQSLFRCQKQSALLSATLRASGLPHCLAEACRRTHSTRQHTQILLQVGGNTNFAIAAARLGLRCACLGHTGADYAGEFLVDVLAQEGIQLQQLLGAIRTARFAAADSLCLCISFVSNVVPLVLFCGDRSSQTRKQSKMSARLTRGCVCFVLTPSARL